MKRHSTNKRPRRTKDEMRGEYRFDHTKAKPNRFAGRIKNGAVAVILDPDVAAVFDSSDLMRFFAPSSPRCPGGDPSEQRPANIRR